jgi:two-component system cell cycle response regulator DivK
MPSNAQHLILIVEDISSNHLLIERSLEKEGYKTLWANNGQEAVDFCKEFPNISLILMDIRLPIMDGFEATKVIREFNSNVPIIAQTAYVMPYEKTKVMEVGCDDLITKPFRVNDIVNIVLKHLAD